MNNIAIQKRIWIDTDITMGEKNGPFSYCDVDDGYAIASLLRSVEVDVVGVSSTLGNTDNINVSTRIATDFIAKYGPNSVQVSRGSSCPLKQCKVDDKPAAIEAMKQALEQGPLQILGIGAATNIALLLRHYPELKSNIQEVVLLAGRQSIDDHFISGSHQPKPFRDLNFEADPLAYAELLASGLNICLVPFEACSKVWIKQHDLLEMLGRSKVARHLAIKSEPWLVEWELVFGASGFNPFDMIAAAYCIRPQWFTIERWRAEIVQGESDTEKHAQKPYLICSEKLSSGPKVSYARVVSADCKDLLLERIKAHDMQHFVLGMSHVNIIVDDVAKASEFYSSALGFEQAFDDQGAIMDYQGVTMESFALDAGIENGEVDVDVRFMRHPQARLFLELMHYRKPQGKATLPPQPRTYDLGGPRHIALEVSNCTEVFNFLSEHEGVQMISSSSAYHPHKLDGFPITFFYWIDPYGVQWEMEEGRQVGLFRGIA
ncbi:nucleoside hydrolase [Alginatibacterium sediminis]|uniref:Nucleoside hydrolase n=1 Tax=Alginatibacterium sediminis TaxID=2164068 RepID=A0A420EDR9_9ALTE|nr:nucleoside hydrolase [Alginatibacterium sediminis]RKF18821.1 nucleoside hydrolase [Alginatibacterium sediminis]